MRGPRLPPRGTRRLTARRAARAPMRAGPTRASANAGRREQEQERPRVVAAGARSGSYSGATSVATSTRVDRQTDEPPSGSIVRACLDRSRTAPVSCPRRGAGAAVYNRSMSADPIILPPGGGRAYDARADARRVQGRRARDAATATACRSGRSNRRRPGPGPHQPRGERARSSSSPRERCRSWSARTWVDAPAGTFLRIPAGVTHDFENRSDAPATAFNFFIPGGFETLLRGWVESGAQEHGRARSRGPSAGRPTSRTAAPSCCARRAPRACPSRTTAPSPRAPSPRLPSASRSSSG